MVMEIAEYTWDEMLNKIVNLMLLRFYDMLENVIYCSMYSINLTIETYTYKDKAEDSLLRC